MNGRRKADGTRENATLVAPGMDSHGMTMSDEIEVKLALSPQDADILESCGLMAGKPKKALQSSIYFDTPDHALLKAGLSLRIRRSGRKRIQTVKAGGAGSAGLFARPEWERTVPDDTPIIDDTMPIRLLLGDLTDGLAPVFEVHIERCAWHIHEGGAAIELVLDRGEVVAADRRSPICEVELELKSGEAAALFAFARKLDAVVPVRLGVLTKSRRGYALLEPVVAAFKAERVELRHDVTAAQAFQHIVQICLCQFRQNEDLFLAGHAPEALHQARIALRRLRSALSIFKTLLDDDVSADLRAGLRWLATELGEARSIDAMIALAPPGALRHRLETARQTAYAHVRGVLASPRVRRLMLDLTEWSVSGAWLDTADAEDIRNQPAREFASDALDRLRRKVKKGRRDLAKGDDQARHKIRKDTKKLRYAAEFFTALFDRKRERRRYRRFISALEALQDELGALNDLAMAPGVLTRLDIADAPGAAALLFPGSRKKILDLAGAAHEAVIDATRFWR
ncbi:MAG: CHAD domain-containing protein [Sphingomonas bacterium]